MTILRYQYPKWPGAWDGTETVTRLGTFDFDLQNVLETLLKVQEVMSKPSHPYGTINQDEKRAALARNIEWVTHQSQLQPEAVIWHHTAQDRSIEQLEADRKKWENDSLQLMFGTPDSPLLKSLNEKLGIKLVDDAETSEAKKSYQEPEYLKDSQFGEYLSSLIYSLRFSRVSCQICNELYLPEQCSFVKWGGFEKLGGSRNGEKLVCPQNHTLHSQTTGILIRRSHPQ